MKNRLKLFFVQTANYHAIKAIQCIKKRKRYLSIYGIGYKDTLEYKLIELRENWHILMHDIFYSLT